MWSLFRIQSPFLVSNKLFKTKIHPVIISVSNHQKQKKMHAKIFYSWQSDTNKKYNKNFIEDCIEKALSQLSPQNNVQVEWSLDRDTKGKIGTIDIVDTIFNKINESHIFIGDITFIDSPNINNKESKGIKRTPNPNVLTELGYAAAKLGWENIIVVFNSAYGKIEDLPFDIRVRRPLFYSYDDTTSDEGKKNIRKELISVLISMITNCNPDKVNLKRRLTREFSNESNEALRLVIDTPELWNLKLVLEILKKNIDEINFIDYEINNNLIFESTTKMELKEFLRWTESLFTNTSKMLAVLNDSLTTEFQKTFQEENEYIFAIKTKININRACRVCLKALEMEKQLISIEVQEELVPLKKLYIGFSNIFIIAIRDLLDNLQQTIDNIEKNGDTSDIKIGVTIKEFLNTEEILDELARLRKFIGVE